MAASSRRPCRSGSADAVSRHRRRRSLAAAAALGLLSTCAPASGDPGPAVADAGSRADSLAALAVRELAPGVYAVPGDSGTGSEGRPNAGFVVTEQGVLVIDALASPRQGERLVRSIRETTDRPIRWLVLTHHHPDHHFGAVAVRRASAHVLAHPERSTLAAESGEAALVRDWTGVVGAEEMRGFAFANAPDAPVVRDTTLVLGGRAVELIVAAGAHTAGDLAVWLPAERVLFAGDLLIEDGVTMVVDGHSGVLLEMLDRLASLEPRVVVPGHGRISGEPPALFELTRAYLHEVRASMRAALERGQPLSRVLSAVPPADEDRPVSRPSRERRNAVRVYLEMERELMGLDAESGTHRGARPAPGSTGADAPGAEGGA